MPELPELETIRRQLAPHVEGGLLEALEIRDERWCAPLAPEELIDATQGRRIERLGRRGNGWRAGGLLRVCGCSRTPTRPRSRLNAEEVRRGRRAYQTRVAA